MHFDEKFWLAVAFFTFVALMAKYVWPIIAKSLDAGSKKIAEEILAAQEMKKEAEKLLAKAEKIHKEASAFAKKLTKDTETEVKKLTLESKKLLEEELVKRRATALDRIKLEEESAIHDLKVKIVDSAMGKLTTELNLDKEGHKKLIEKSLNNIGKVTT